MEAKDANKLLSSIYHQFVTPTLAAQSCIRCIYQFQARLLETLIRKIFRSCTRDGILEIKLTALTLRRLYPLAMPHVVVRKSLESRNLEKLLNEQSLQSLTSLETTLKIAHMVKHPCPFSCPCCQSFQGIDTLGYGLAAVVGYTPDACHVMKIEERPANVFFTRNNSQVHGADQHESELEPPSCKRTLGLRFFPTIAAHSIEDWKPILVAATFWAVTHCCKYPIWPYA